MNFLVNPMFGDDLGRTGKGIKEGVGPPKPLRESSEHTQSCPLQSGPGTWGVCPQAVG